MADLPVREIVLYKHGVGFFAREGEFTGNSITLTFRQDEINDVLKSLAVFDRTGGQILGIHYQTPMDVGARLANSSIHLSDTDSLRGLIRDLRGRRCTVISRSLRDGEKTIVGRVIGIDEPFNAIPLDTNQQYETRITILDVQEQVQVLSLGDIQAITINDVQSQHDLSYFLDTSMTEESQRSVHIQLNEGDHQLVVNYVIPSPTWRVSYRVIAESNEDGETGKAYLQGWGLFDNRLEEDLEDVQVTLVAGQPISFIYDLFTSRIPERRTVQDESRIAPGPVEFAGWVEPQQAAVTATGQFYRAAAKADTSTLAAPAPAGGTRHWGTASASRQEMAASTAIETDSKEAGEFFQYVVRTPVSVKRGESALVPIIGAELEYNRELLYNSAKLASHPVAALRFMNTTGLTLERGPITVVEDADYKGEAVVPFTKDKNEVYLPYAVELGIRIVERQSNRTKTNKLSIDKGGYLIREEHHIWEVTYTIENNTAKNVMVLIEAPIQAGYSLFEMPDPDVETATERRWKVNAAAHQKTEFVRRERTMTQRQEALRNLTYDNLKYFMENRWLDKSTINELREMLDSLALIEKAKTQQASLKVERQTVYDQQEQLRENLKTLQGGGDEANLRKRMLDQLEKSQDRLDAIENEISDSIQQANDAAKRVESIIEALGNQ